MKYFNKLRKVSLNLVAVPLAIAIVLAQPVMSRLAAPKTPEQREQKLLDLGRQAAKDVGIKPRILTSPSTKAGTVTVVVPTGSYYNFNRDRQIKDGSYAYRLGNPVSIEPVNGIPSGALQIGKTWKLRSGDGTTYTVRIAEIAMSVPVPDGPSFQNDVLENQASSETTFIVSYEGTKILPKNQRFTLA